MESVWSKTCEIERREALSGDMECEVAVIGAGMAGVLIANVLQKSGRQVVVLEAVRIASGQTRNTTAKITSQHGMIYSRLIDTVGEEKARQYATANQKAVLEYKNLIQERGIDCDFEEMDAYVYAQEEERLKREAEAAASLGLPASYVSETHLPFQNAGAVRFTNQAQFHPLKFLKAVTEKLEIYENTRVQKVETCTPKDSKEAVQVLTTDHGTVKAKKVVFACHYPFVNFPGMYFTRMHQERSYVLALKNAPKVHGMYIGEGEITYSLRNYGDYLIFGGENHRTGENREGGRYQALREKAAELFPGCHEAACWSAQDCITPDNIPYIGRYASGKPDWYVATGFHKWGMSTSMVASMILNDLICGIENPFAEVFAPDRLDGQDITGIVCEGAHAVKGLGKRLFQLPAETAAELGKGCGGIVMYEGEKVGVFKDEDGELYGVDIRCPHLGCQLEWNPDERSWDCPCHGSRFDRFGKLISNPAQVDVSRYA